VYQERSHQEVRDKLYSYGLHRGDVDELLSRLITEGFLNEERFAKAFAGGKFRMMRWGRNKIKHELEQRHISARCVRQAMLEIDESDYRKVLKTMLQKRLAMGTGLKPFQRRDKAARFAIGKGYEPDLVWALLRDTEE